MIEAAACCPNRPLLKVHLRDRFRTRVLTSPNSRSVAIKGHFSTITSLIIINDNTIPSMFHVISSDASGQIGCTTLNRDNLLNVVRLHQKIELDEPINFLQRISNTMRFISGGECITEWEIIRDKDTKGGFKLLEHKKHFGVGSQISCDIFNSSVIVTATTDRRITIFKIKDSGELSNDTTSFRVNYEILSVRFSPNNPGVLLLTTPGSATVRVLDTATSENNASTLAWYQKWKSSTKDECAISGQYSFLLPLGNNNNTCDNDENINPKRQQNYSTYDTVSRRYYRSFVPHTAVHPPYDIKTFHNIMVSTSESQTNVWSGYDKGVQSIPIKNSNKLRPVITREFLYTGDDSGDITVWDLKVACDSAKWILHEHSYGISALFLTDECTLVLSGNVMGGIKLRML